MGFRNLAYFFALFVTVFAGLFLTFYLTLDYIDWIAHMSERYAPNFIALGSLILAAFTGFATVFWGWRKDRREARESEAIIRELNLKIDALMAKVSDPNSTEKEK